MIIVKKAILHIFDLQSGVTVFSEQMLDLNVGEVRFFIEKQLEKSFVDQGARKGTFYSNSQFKQQIMSYLSGELDLVGLSTQFGKAFIDQVEKSENPCSSDLLVCECTDNETQSDSLAILVLNNRTGFTHQVQTDGDGVKNNIINHYAILPAVTQKIDEFVFIDKHSLAVRLSEKKRRIDGQDAYVIADSILACDLSVSPKAALGLVSKITKEVAEKHGQNSAVAVSQAKTYIAENAEVSVSLDPIALGMEVFSSSAPMREDYLTEMKKAGITDCIDVDKTFAIKASKHHKMKTDTGIEISVPADYLQNSEFIEFINNPNGTISIQLKNIGRITNK